MAGILTDIKNKYTEIRGFHTKRHLVVIESDDWGSIRMPSKAVFNKLIEHGDNPNNDPYLSNDCLENEKDLDNLFQVLSSVTDMNGRTAVMTANFAMANPDFDNIDYSVGNYAYEPFYKTYDRYYTDNNILYNIKCGINKGVFFPQLHCREHLNVKRWMRDLKNGKKDVITAFDNKMIGIGSSFSADNIYGYMDAFNTDCSDDSYLESVITDAVSLFENTFGYKSKTFVASCFIWSSAFEQALKNEGIYAIQSGFWQHIPCGKNGEYKLKRKLHFTGEKNRRNQIYTVRNCNYEPAYNQNPKDSASECFYNVVSSFECKKPAVINSHRLNYIGSINPNNSENNLLELKNLLLRIRDTYKDVEFISSAELVDIIREK